LSQDVEVDVTSDVDPLPRHEAEFTDEDAAESDPAWSAVDPRVELTGP
jgi:hypothetical protein